MIKHLPSLAILAVAAGIFTAAPAAHADALYGPLTVEVWTGSNISNNATLVGKPSGAANFTFTYTGPLDFVNNNGQSDPNTFREFFGSYASDISGLNTTSADFLDTAMSTSNFGITSYMLFTGDYTGGGSVSVYHDDGASLYYGPLTSPTSVFEDGTGYQTTDSGTLPTGTNAPFDLVYVEANGAPSDLVVTGMSPVPEPGTFGLMALSMIGLAGLAYRGSVFNS